MAEPFTVVAFAAARMSAPFVVGFLSGAAIDYVVTGIFVQDDDD